MEDTVLNIIYDYTKSGKIIDKNGIENLISTIVNYTTLNDFVRELRFDTGENNQVRNFYALGKYNFENKTITIYIEQINEYLTQKSKMYLDDKYERLLYINLEILKIVFHEVKHAHQSRFQEKKDNSLIKDLLNFCDMTVLTDSKLYEMSWEYDPKERDAENFANAYIIRLQYKLDKSLYRINFLLNKDLNNQIFRGYGNNPKIYPFLKYLTIVYNDSSAIYNWFKEKEFKELSFKDRFNYGLELSNDEYENMLRMKRS